MKSKKILTALFTAASVATLLGTAPVTVNAASSNSDATTTNAKKSPKMIIQNTPKLSKWGYVINVNSSAQPIYVGKSNYAKMVNNPHFKGNETVSPKKIKNVRFKIEKVMHFQGVGGAPEYFVTSKDHKYNGWTPNAGLQYYAINSKTFQKVIKPLKKIEGRSPIRPNKKFTSKGKITDRKWLAKNEHDYALAVKAAKKLKGDQRKFVLGSLKQMKQDCVLRNVMMEKKDNILLWSVN
ncbi:MULTISPECIES: hypothetical protein [unclassified Lactobacillus]|uniref:hypothetical protein n=1 Tax=unclassified Lactobacillus TaxID=2620435 RepID=UPI000BEED298|nr:MULTISPECIES: hypothetical protein [unclassified Lactobacillus]PEG86382.1 hypothetical protein CP365_08495 [Lactobacillus sp. UMNPBX14]PEH01934.1 hypothetical protein CP357_08455 [Lactobacillus sp. UMNPBX6]PEH06589.1 hypothetical protein CP355_03335 [Lactobacillus sp. UMNPBX4]